jgi:hypothetical protein
MFLGPVVHIVLTQMTKGRFYTPAHTAADRIPAASVN